MGEAAGDDLVEPWLIRKGRDLEKVVLARAVNLHLRNGVLVCGNKRWCLSRGAGLS
jgi:formyltetrahydrofolate hydrolase